MGLFVHGAKLYRGDALVDDTPVYTALPGIATVGLPVGFTTDSLESTDHDSPDFTKEYEPGLIDRGTIPFTLNFDHTETEHQDITAGGVGRVKTAWKVELPLKDPTNTVKATYEFDGYIESMDPPEAGSDGILQMSGEIRVASATTFTPEAAV